MLRNISIQKRSVVKTDKHPTHDLVACDDNYSKESKLTVGSLWTKVATDKEGKDYKFLSGSLSKERDHEGVHYEGYCLISDTEYKEYIALKTPKNPNEGTGEVAIDDIPF